MGKYLLTKLTPYTHTRVFLFVRLCVFALPGLASHSSLDQDTIALPIKASIDLKTVKLSLTSHLEEK